jgi:hypothetical protein
MVRGKFITGITANETILKLIRKETDNIINS